MRLYLDASVIVALLTTDALSERTDIALRSHRDIVVVSDFAAAEFASAIARRFRMGELTALDAQKVFTVLDDWTARLTHRVTMISDDVIFASSLCRRLDLGLRTPDALHLAIARRQSCVLASFDDRLLQAAQTLRQPVWSEAPG